MGTTTTHAPHRQALRLTLIVATAALTVVGLLAPGAPAGAAPPAVTHAGLVNGNPIDNTPHVLDGRTEAVLDLGDRVIVGGLFSRVKKFSVATEYSRPHLFAYDKATGNIDPVFNPRPNGKVTALLRAADGSVLVAGQFKAIGGRNVPYLAKLDPVTGAVSTSFVPTPNGMVYDLHQANGLLYLGGTFTKVGPAARTNFAVVDPATGGVRGNEVGFASAPRGTTRVMRFDVTPDGRKLVAIGNFTRVGGQTRENIAVLDLATNGNATVAGWRTDRYKDLTCGSRLSSWDTPTYDVDIAPAGGWFVVVTTGGPGGRTKLCDTATRWEIGATSVASPTWVNWSGGDSLTSVAVTGSAVYVAGHFRWLDNPDGADSKGPGAVSRYGIGALSTTSGKALSWSPSRDRGLVAPRLVPTAEGLYVLSDSEEFGQEWHPRLTYLTLTGQLPPVTPPPPPPPTGTKPGAPGTPTVSASGLGTATVAWAAASATAAKPVTGYTVTARNGATVLATKEAGTARSIGFTGLPSARPVTFTVVARTSAGAGPSSAPSQAAILPFASVDAFTTRQYRDLVGRVPTGAELSDWRSKVGGGSLTPQAAIDQLLSSTAVGKVASVVRLYDAYYGRLPDGGGFRYWRDQVRAGWSVDRVSQQFAQAPEFKRLYGTLDDGQFVDLVYRNVLGRAPDRNGRAYWVSQLQRGVSRGKVMTGFSESPENKNATRRTTDIVLVVHLMLDRRPDTAELADTRTRPDLVRAVLLDAEYDARV